MNFLRTLDPSFSGINSATRGSLAVITSFLLVGLFSPKLSFLSSMLSMMPMLIVMDTKKTDQIKTTLFIIPVAIVTVLIPILLVNHHLYQLILFPVLTFIAVYVRKFGARGVALGFMSFWCYFYPLFIPIYQNEISQTICAIFISISSVMLYRFILFPDRQEKIIKNFLNTWNLFYYELAEKVKNNEPASFLKLNSLTLQIENFCFRGDSYRIKDKIESLQRELFRRETELQFKGIIHYKPIVLNEIDSEEISKDMPVGLATAGNSPKLLSTTKLAIQAFLAVSLSSYFGLMVAPQKWYWGPMTVFVILTGTSRGETFLRAKLRVSGTILGLIIGYLVNPHYQGNTQIEWGLIIVLMFLGLFSFRFTFGFWSSVSWSYLVTILFNVMGVFTDQMLIWRFEETLLGAILGALVSSIVLPISTSNVTKEAITKTLDAQADVLSMLPLESSDKLNVQKLVKAIRKMEEEFSNLKLLAAPYTERYSFLRKTPIIQMIHHVTGLNLFVKHLATNKDSKMTIEEVTKIREKIKYASLNVDQYLKNADLLKELANLTKLNK